MKYLLPRDVRLQCPECNAPVEEVETFDPNTGEVSLTPCGHIPTVRSVREAWGIPPLRTDGSSVPWVPAPAD